MGMSAGGDFAVIDGVVEGVSGAVATRDYVPASGTAGSAPFLWIHGGAFVSGGLDQVESDAVARALACRGRWVRTVAYRLVPRISIARRAAYRAHPNRFPAALDDVIAAWGDLSDRTSGRSRGGAIGGASAGAGLAAAAMVRLRDEGGRLPSAAVLAYGTFHAELPPLTADIRRRTSGTNRPLRYEPWMVRRMNLNYVGSDAGLEHPHAFAGGGELSGLPPTLLIDADRDTLRASGEKFARELATADVTVRQAMIPHSRHGFLDRPRSGAFADGIDAIDGWLAEHG